MIWKLTKRFFFLLLMAITAPILLLWISSWKSAPSNKILSGLPPATNRSMDQVLHDLEIELKRNQPGIEEKLRPGIAAEQLSDVQTRLGVPLHPDIQALYRWHNGLEQGAELFPGYEFYPLEEAIRMNEEMRESLDERGIGWLMPREKSWLILFPDPAGDGYYFDYQRDYAKGSVFYVFRESGYFMYFPSIKNLLTAVTECYRQGAYQGTQVMDFDLELEILRSYGQETGP